MGNSASQTAKDYITTNVNYSQTVSSTLRLENDSTINSTNVNSIMIDNGGADCCVLHSPSGEDAGFLPGCTGSGGEITCEEFKIKQTIDQEVDVVQQISSDYAQQLSTALQNTAQNDISNALDQLQENDLLSGFSDKTKEEILEDIMTNINTTLNTDTVIDIVNSMVANSSNENNTVLYNCGIITGENCTIDQNISSKIVTQNILSSIADLAQDTTAVNDFYTKINDALSQIQKGVVGTVADALVDFFAKIGQLGLIILIGGAVFFFLIIAILILVKVFRKPPVSA